MHHPMKLATFEWRSAIFEPGEFTAVEPFGRAEVLGLSVDGAVVAHVHRSQSGGGRCVVAGGTSAITSARRLPVDGVL
jgi:hypothetical protein